MSADASSTMDGSVYLVAVRDFVVSQDLVDTIREFEPFAAVATAHNCREALTAVETSPRLALAFVEPGPDRVLRARLVMAIRQRGGRLVLLGDDAEEEWESGAKSGRLWPVLMRPFSSQVVTSLLIASRRD